MAIARSRFAPRSGPCWGAGRHLSRLLSTALIITGAAALMATGCKSMGHSSTTGPSTLYDRLGGEKAVSKVVDDFVAKASTDPAVNFTRKGYPNEWEPSEENVDKLKKHLVEFIAHATGGPQAYEGRDMTVVHTGMYIKEREWNAAVADLKSALDQNNVPAKLQSELIRVVATTHDSVVGH